MQKPQMLSLALVIVLTAYYITAFTCVTCTVIHIVRAIYRYGR